jgi:hypothetical protein
VAGRSTESLGGMKEHGRLAKIIVVLAAAYSAIAVSSFVFLFDRTRIDLVGWFFAWVLPPYVLLYLAIHFRRGRPSTFNAIVVTICAALAGLGYALSFEPTDSEYAIVFYVVPIIQFSLGIVALTVSLWRHPRTGSSHAT